METRLRVKIEKQKDGSYIAYNTDDSNFTLIGEGLTVSEAKNDFSNSMKEVVESIIERGEPVPFVLINEPEFKLI